MDSLHEAFIHLPEACEARFNMDGCGLFNAWKSQDNF